LLAFKNFPGVLPGLLEPGHATDASTRPVETFRPRTQGWKATRVQQHKATKNYSVHYTPNPRPAKAPWRSSAADGRYGTCGRRPGRVPCHGGLSRRLVSTACLDGLSRRLVTAKLSGEAGSLTGEAGSPTGEDGSPTGEAGSLSGRWKGFSSARCPRNRQGKPPRRGAGVLPGGVPCLDGLSRRSPTGEDGSPSAKPEAPGNRAWAPGKAPKGRQYGHEFSSSRFCSKKVLSQQIRRIE